MIIRCIGVGVLCEAQLQGKTFNFSCDNKVLRAFNANIKNDYHILAPAGGRITAILVRLAKGPMLCLFSNFYCSAWTPVEQSCMNIPQKSLEI